MSPENFFVAMIVGIFYDFSLLYLGMPCSRACKAETYVSGEKVAEGRNILADETASKTYVIGEKVRI